MKRITKVGVALGAAVVTLVTVGGVQAAQAESGMAQANWVCC